VGPAAAADCPASGVGVSDGPTITVFAVEKHRVKIYLYKIDALECGCNSRRLRKWPILIRRNRLFLLGLHRQVYHKGRESQPAVYHNYAVIAIQMYSIVGD
jgi:hypothetical protein